MASSQSVTGSRKLQHKANTKVKSDYGEYFAAVEAGTATRPRYLDTPNYTQYDTNQNMQYPQMQPDQYQQMQQDQYLQMNPQMMNQQMNPHMMNQQMNPHMMNQQMMNQQMNPQMNQQMMNPQMMNPHMNPHMNPYAQQQTNPYVQTDDFQPMSYMYPNNSGRSGSNMPTIRDIDNAPFVAEIMGNDIPFGANNTMTGGRPNKLTLDDDYLNFIELSKVIENTV